MFQDGVAPLHQAVHPRQTPSGGTRSTSFIPSSTTVVPSIVSSATWISQAAFRTLSEGETIDFGPDPCTAALPPGGIIQLNETYTILLDQAASYVAQYANQSIFANQDGVSSNSTVLNVDGVPFYASISPQMYALATATVISYVLVILIFITPRTFYINGPGGSSGPVGPGGGLRTLIPGSGGRSKSVLGVGRRPLLQKIAALTVAISLTIATADTFRVAKHQYTSQFIDSKTLVQDVVNSTEIRVIRVISDTFLWLAQVQTLIRLFPRHKEKVTIKWLGFGLVLCDTVFSILENFIDESHRSRPGNFTDAIPTLSYLFELSISLIYASCVLYYGLSKRRWAFWHSRMRNVCLVAMISVIAVLIPVVFFITDLAQPDIATWGEYIRWVGAAAASVVVWEWVERIEALERDEKKDGILGREIFDGDEMLELTPTEDGYDQGNPGGAESVQGGKRSHFWKNVRDLHIDFHPKIPLKALRRSKKAEREDETVEIVDGGPVRSNRHEITRPPQAITPISRTDTNSAASTVYAVRYHDPFSPSPAIPEEAVVETRARPASVVNVLPAISDESTLTNSTGTTVKADSEAESKQAISTGRQIWQGVTNPFKRKRTEPPAEVAAQIAESNSRRSPADSALHIRNKFNSFTLAQKTRFGTRMHRNKSPLTVTFIPAQPRASQPNIERDASEHEAESTTSGQPEPAESESNSDLASPDLASLPVTVIPPPVRGGRTWSPEDLQNQQATPPAHQDEPPMFPFGEQSHNFTAGTDNVSPIQTQREALTISESPGRVRGTPTPSNGTPSTLYRSRNNRSATIASISHRLGSASPNATLGSAGPRSATADSTGPERSATTDSHRAPPPA